MTPILKRCCRCKQEKRVDDFYASSTSLDMLKAYCKSCTPEREVGDRGLLVKRDRAEVRSTLKSALPGIEVAGHRVQDAVAKYDAEAVRVGDAMNRLRLAALKVAEEVDNVKALVREALR